MGLLLIGDRKGGLVPQLFPKGRRGFGGFVAKIISMYFARGMRVRELQAHLKQLYAVLARPPV